MSRKKSPLTKGDAERGGCPEVPTPKAFGEGLGITTPSPPLIPFHGTPDYWEPLQGEPFRVNPEWGKGEFTEKER